MLYFNMAKIILEKKRIFVLIYGNDGRKTDDSKDGRFGEKIPKSYGG